MYEVILELNMFVISPHNINHFINMPYGRITRFAAELNDNKDKLFSTLEINKNEWFIHKYLSFGLPIEQFEEKLTEDDVLMLRLMYDKILIVSEFVDEGGDFNIPTTRFTHQAGILTVNRHISTLVRMIKPKAIVFEGSFESALISFIKSKINYKHISYEEYAKRRDRSIYL